MADQTILSKWQALFPSQDPLSQPDQVGGMGMGESPSLLNYTLSPTRSKGEPATDVWSPTKPHPVKGDTDIIAMWNRSTNISGQFKDEETRQLKDGTLLANLVQERAKGSLDKIPMSGQNTTRFLTQHTINAFEDYTRSPSLESDNEVITMAEFT